MVRRILSVAAVVASISGAYADSELPPGSDKTGTTRVLEAGAAILQTDSPVDAMNIHLVGIHPMKSDPAHQMDAHHFCRQVNEDFAQCALFDGSGSDANLNGIEYIISAELFEKLPDEEKQFWHPHNYEILSGTLVAPNIPHAAEIRLMEGKMNSYGKTWHTWRAQGGNQEADELPLGKPVLAWSLNRDGEADPELLKWRQEKLGMDPQETRERRAELRSLAKPQSGVDVLEGQFKRPTQPLEGVSAAQDRSQVSQDSNKSSAPAKR